MNIAPLSNAKFTAVRNNQNVTFGQNKNDLITKEDKGDSWNFSVNKKKAAKFAAIAAVLTVAAAGAIYAIRRGRAPKEANGMIKEANEFINGFKEKFQSTIDETIAVYNNGGKNAEGKIVAIITEDAEDPAKRIMRGVLKEGEMSSTTSVFINDKLGSLEKLRDDGKFDTIFFKDNGQMSICREGEKSEIFDNIRQYTTDKIAFLEDDKPFMYMVGEFFDGDIYGRQKHVSISKAGKPTGYMEDYITDHYGNYTAKTWMTLMGRGLSQKWYNMAEGIHKA